MRTLAKLFVCLTLFFGLISMTSGLVQAQAKIDNDTSRFTNYIALVPQYAIRNGIRVDYARRLKNHNHWLIFAPQFYSDMNGYYWSPSNYYGAYQTMTGAGINMYYQFVVFKSAKKNRSSNISRQSIYFAFGPNFQYYSLKNTEEVASPFEEDGVTYYRFNLEEVRKSLYRVGAVADVGYQLAFDRFLLDLYLGVAVKYSLDGNGQIIEGYYDEWTDITYSGILMDGGVKLGFFF